MNVLVIGSGGREHALVWKIKQSPRVDKIYCVPGNAGIASTAECIKADISDFAEIEKIFDEKSIGLIVVGPEVPLSQGIVDHFEKAGKRIFGPCKAAAKLEWSKAFSKAFMRKHGIQTASFSSFTSLDDCLEALSNWPKGRKLVVKADGLAAGKGVIICEYPELAKSACRLILEKNAFGEAGKEVVVEEFLEGEEASLQIFLDGKNYSPMVSAQDHKRVKDLDVGPNTGGMGAYAPAPVIDPALMAKIDEKIIKKIIRGLNFEDIDYRGVLYIGLMISGGEPHVLEFNCRFGDPETQVVLPLLKTDIIEIMEKIIDGELDNIKIDWYNKAALCVVAASGGYPGDYKKGILIKGLEETLSDEKTVIFHAGTSFKNPKQSNGGFVTAGGRVLGITGIGADIREAAKNAYDTISKISFKGMHYRRDIGRRALERK